MFRTAVRHCHPVLFSSKGAGELVTLSREKALNSLNVEMIEMMLPKYKEWHAKPKDSMFVVMKGAGSKAFCAGGDIVCLVKDEPRGVREQFFYREYQLNYAIMTLPHPHIALWNGIVMGGGVGLSVHGSHRIATEKATFAMPETGIGLFPDVGGTWFLPRLPHEGLGKYLALTGHRLKGADLVHAGIATHFIPSDRLSKFEDSLLDFSTTKGLREFIDKQAMPRADLPPFSLGPMLHDIKKFFGNHATNMDDLMHTLKIDSSEVPDWKEKTVHTIEKMSPSSLKVSLELNNRGGKMTDPKEMFTTEYNVAQRCMQTKDFFAGVTALLIEKTGKPIWHPDTLQKVYQEDIDRHFAPSRVPWHPTAPFPTSSNL